VSESLDAPAAPLTVETDLTVRFGDTAAPVSSTGDRLFVEFPTLLAATRAVRSVPASGVRELHETLVATGLTLELRVRHRTVAALGAGVRSGAVARYADIAPADLRVCGVLSTVGAAVGDVLHHARRLGR
jgi:hypothetical protein